MKELSRKSMRAPCVRGFLTATMGFGTLVGLARCGEVDESHDHPDVERAEQPLFPHTSKLWTTLSIPVCWENPSTQNATERSWTQQAVERTWEAVSAVDFTGWGACPSSGGSIRIRIRDEGPHVKALGSDLRGRSEGMVLNFTFVNWSTGCQATRQSCIESIAVHEFGHALGFAHEQNRGDTPAWCDREQGSNGNEWLGEWDRESVMNYCSSAWNNNGVLSRMDTLGVQILYGVPAPCHSVCEEGNRLSAICDPAVFDVCQENPSCCGSTWDASCIATFQRKAGVECGCAHDKEVTGSKLLASCDSCVERVCRGDPYCCSTAWDSLCVSQVSSVCGCGHDKHTIGAPLAPICDDCVAEVCLQHPRCCSSSWDATCVGHVSSVCGITKDDLIIYRPGTGAVAVTRSNGDGSFTSMYSVGDNGAALPNGIAGFDLLSPNDRVVVFDHNGDGRQDLLLYRPGSGAALVASSNGNGSFSTVVMAAPHGVPGYDLRSTADVALPLDYDGDGRDDLLFYRPGQGAVAVIRSNTNGTFSNVYTVGDNGSAPPNGLGGYDLLSTRDQVVALDYDGDRRDDLLFYRPGTGAVVVSRSLGNGTFGAVYSVGDNGAAPPNGFAFFDLLHPADRVEVLDFNGDGRDDILLYRPGQGAVAVARSNGNGTFTGTYTVPDDGREAPNGFDGFNLLNPADRVLVFDFDGDDQDDLFLYRPGSGAASVLRSTGVGTFVSRYFTDHLPHFGPAGIPGMDLKSGADRAIALDYNGDGRDDLLVYRPGTGAVGLARSAGDGTFSSVYAVEDNGAALPNGVPGFDLLSPSDQVCALDFDGRR